MRYFFKNLDNDALDKELSLIETRMLDNDLYAYSFLGSEQKRIDAFVCKRDREFFISFDQITWQRLSARKTLGQIVVGEQSWHGFAGFVPRRSGDNGGEGLVTKMPGKVVQIKVKEGDLVSQGQTLVIFEAMKMEQELKSPKSGKVVKINVSNGSAVEQGTQLLDIEEV